MVKIQNNTGIDLRLRFWEIVNEDDVSVIGSLDILKGEGIDEVIPDVNIQIEELKQSSSKEEKGEE